MEEAVAFGRDEVKRDAVCARRRPGQREAQRIAAERGDVIDPLERGALIEQPVIASAGTFRSQRGVPQESKRTQPVVGRDDEAPVAATKCSPF